MLANKYNPVMKNLLWTNVWSVRISGGCLSSSYPLSLIATLLSLNNSIKYCRTVMKQEFYGEMKQDPVERYSFETGFIFQPIHHAVSKSNL